MTTQDCLTWVCEKTRLRTSLARTLPERGRVGVQSG